MRILIAGFGPFPGAPFNPSARLAAELAHSRRPALAGVERRLHIFPTVYASVDGDLPKLFAAKPDIILIFGVAGRRRQLCIETRAQNRVSMIFPDANRYRPQRAVIAPGRPSSRRGNAPFASILGAARSSKAAARLSRDAGRYLCNYVYWQALDRARGGGTLVQFVHIPPMRRISPQTLRAAQAMLIALIAARRAS